MTTPDTVDDTGTPAEEQKTPPRPESRAARLAQPLAVDALREMAEDYGVCTRPMPFRKTDLATGQTEVIDLPCRATRSSKCKPCAERAKKLRAAQCRQGWHRDDEPITPNSPDQQQRDLIAWRAELEFRMHAAEARADWQTARDERDAIEIVEKLIAATGLRGRIVARRVGGTQGDEQGGARRVRSTRRRQDVPDLPRKKVSARTIGRTFTGREGKLFRPSMFITPTLPSYGRVGVDGAPLDPVRYDYRRAAWDAVHFPALLDRFRQNLRRVEGWNIQYFGGRRGGMADATAHRPRGGVTWWRSYRRSVLRCRRMWSGSPPVESCIGRGSGG